VWGLGKKADDTSTPGARLGSNTGNQQSRRCVILSKDVKHHLAQNKKRDYCHPTGMFDPAQRT